MEETHGPATERIGTVHSDFSDPADPFEMRRHDSTIVVDDRFAEGLYRLEEHRFVQVVFRFHRSESYDLVGTRYDGERTGVFASRSPRRPSGIGVTTVELLARDGNSLTVRGLDAIDGTPVLDIKPSSSPGKHTEEPGEKPEIVWHQPDRPPFRLSGFAWHGPGSSRRYRRLPVETSAPLPEAVDHLADCTAGGQVAFRTDSSVVRLRTLLSGPASMYHMPATGQCGFDIYVGVDGPPRYHTTSRFEIYRSWKYESELFNGAGRVMRTCVINFPLYQGVEELEIGLSEGARLEAPPDFARPGRIVVYGTSITQGGCASRPGMAYTNVLSRRLDVEFVNLGFSGAGRGETEVLGVVAETPRASAFILDYEANAGDIDTYSSTLAEAVSILRSRHPDVPILIVSRVAFARDLVDPASERSRALSSNMQRRFVASKSDAGDRNIHFLDGAGLLGEDFEECTVDGVHPNDLGLMRMANGMEPTVRRLIAADA